MATTIQKIHKPTRARALDTSGNNNHGQIYSGRALEFDGVSDYLLCGGTDKCVDIRIDSGSGTFACWFKADDVTPEGALIINGNTPDGAQHRLGLSVEGGVVCWNKYDAGGSTYAPFNSSTIESNTWYRAVGVIVDGTQSLYINGVAQTDTGDSPQSYLSGSDDLTIGMTGSTTPSNQRHFAGKICDVQIWDAAWTAEDALYDYNNPEQLALNRGGTSLTNSNLKRWYPMNDGHRGQQSYILDASNTALGDELLTTTDLTTVGNQVIAADSTLNGWTHHATYQYDSVTASSSGIRIVSNGVNDLGSAYQSVHSNSFVATEGVIYRFEYTAIKNSGGNISVNVQNNPVGSSIISTGSNELSGSVTNEVIYFTADSDSDSTCFVDFYTPSTRALDWTISYISLKPINDKNHATTVFYGDELNTQANAVTPQYSSASEAADSANWTNSGMTNFGASDTGVTQGAKSLRMDVDGNGDYAHTNFTNTIVGRTYRFQWDWLISNHSSTNRIEFKIGTSADDDTNGSIVSYTENTATSQVTGTYKDFVATATTTFFTCREDGDGNDANLYLDNLSLREIGTASGWTDADQQLDIPQTALQSYNQLAWFPGEDPGTDYDINFGSGTELDDIWDGGGTFSAWIYPVDGGASNAGRIADKDNWLFYTTSAGTKLGYTFNHGTTNASGTTDNAVLTAGEWAHVVISYNSSLDGAGNEPKIYVNGEQVTVDETDADGSYNSDASDSLYIGNEKDGTRTFHGCITEASLWGSGLSADNVKELYNDGKALSAIEHSTYVSSPGTLKGYWRNNGLSTWSDLSDNSNNGTVNNITETMLITAGVDGSRDSQGFLMNRQRATNSLNLGRNTYSAVKNANSMQDTLRDSFSVGFWVKTAEGRPTNNEEIMGTANNSNEDYFVITMRTNGTIRCQYKANNDGFDKYSSAIIADTATGSWHYIVLTVEKNAANGLKFYIDGAFSSQEDTNGVTDGNWEAWTSNDNLGIGNIYDDGAFSSNYYFDGELDDIVFYSDILILAEIKRNYNAGKRSHK